MITAGLITADLLNPVVVGLDSHAARDIRPIGLFTFDDFNLKHRTRLQVLMFDNVTIAQLPEVISIA